MMMNPTLCIHQLLLVLFFVVVPEHDMAPHVILLVVRVGLLNVRDAEAFPLTCILKSLFVTL